MDLKLKKCLQFGKSYDKISIVPLGNAGVSEWQTRQTQNLLWATTCGFKSRRRQCIKSRNHVKPMVPAFFVCKYFLFRITILTSGQYVNLHRQRIYCRFHLSSL